MPAQDADKVARLMTEADPIGQEGHGVFRLQMYTKRICAGGMNMRPKFSRVSERTATALIDGDNGMSHFAVHHVSELAMEKARTTGVAWVWARMSNHAGPSS